ncbi:hypothetical protein CIPAW_08G043600 [Carya illinoinensis]|uniref:Uncharacterized protein n=1 Tax=Carya illinoinensis TaxID=32201 RepID=A0A8T1PQ26_CARIL|nr:hypothetical protein CIPAW_08G043600 [Carya illinoinensis]
MLRRSPTMRVTVELLYFESFQTSWWMLFVEPASILKCSGWVACFTNILSFEDMRNNEKRKWKAGLRKWQWHILMVPLPFRVKVGYEAGYEPSSIATVAFEELTCSPECMFLFEALLAAMR